MGMLHGRARFLVAALAALATIALAAATIAPAAAMLLAVALRPRALLPLCLRRPARLLGLRLNLRLSRWLALWLIRRRRRRLARLLLLLRPGRALVRAASTFALWLTIAPLLEAALPVTIAARLISTPPPAPARPAIVAAAPPARPA